MSYLPARLYSLAELVPWNRFLKSLKIRACLLFLHLLRFSTNSLLPPSFPNLVYCIHPIDIYVADGEKLRVVLWCLNQIGFRRVEGAVMEFLDISLTKDSSLLLHAIHSPFYWRILRKTILYSGFKNPYKKNPRNKKNSSLFMNSILWNGKMRVEHQTKTQVREDSSLCPETSTTNAVQNSISGIPP